MRKENLFKNKATKGLVAALAFAMATTMVPVNADAASKSLTIAKGDSKKLAANLTNAKTNKKSVATVTKKGKVTAKKAGKATITATKNGKKVTYKITVKKAPTISKKNVTVRVGNSKKLTVTKNGAKYLGVSFKSNNTAVAKVNKNGKITGVKKGTAVITTTIKGYNKTYKLKTTVTVKKALATTPTEPTDPVTPDEPDTPVTPAVTDQTINQATTLADGEYNNVTITADVADNTTVNLGNTKINKLYIESGSDYIVDATQAEIGEVEVVEKGGVASQALNGIKAPRLSFGNNAKAATTKLTARGAVQLTGTVKIASVSVLGVNISVRVEIPVATVTIEGNSAKVSLNSAVDEVAVKATGVTMSIGAAVQKVSVEGQGASIIVKSNVTVAEMTVAAADVKVQGNGTVTTLAINANNATISTNVTTATVGTGVTNTTIAGQAVAAGQTVTDQKAVPGQTDTDAAEVTTTTTPGNNNSSGTSSGSGTSTSSTVLRSDTIEVGKGTKTLTVVVGGETIEISKDGVMGYIKNGTAIPVTRNGIAATPVTPNSSITPPSTTTGYTAEMTNISVGLYTYTVRVTGTNYESATVTVSANVPSYITSLTLVADKEARSTGTVTLTNDSATAARLTVGNDTLTIPETALQAYKRGEALVGQVSINGAAATNVTLKPATNTPVNDDTAITEPILQGNYTLGDNVVYLFVDNYTVSGNTKTANVTAIAYVPAGISVSLTSVTV